MYAQFRVLPRWQQSLIVLVGVVLIGIIVALCATLQFLNWDFRNNLWGPAHLLVTGRSPYHIDQLFENSNSVWMPMAVGAFSVLGVLTQNQATTLWAIVSLFAYVGIVVWATQREKPTPILLAIALMSALLFPPFVSHLSFGQFSILTVFITVVLAQLVNQKANPLLCGLLMTLILTKPQLAILSVMGLLVLAYRMGGKRYVGQMIASVVVWCILLILPLWICYPNWVEGFLWALNRNYTWLHPSSLLFLRTQLGDVGTGVWLVLAGVVFVGSVRLWWTMPVHKAVLWCLALTALITPYVWSYDFVVLIPLLIFILFETQSYLTKVAWVLFYLLIWVYFFHLRTTTSNSDDVFWWTPSACLIMALGVLWIDKLLVRWQIALPKPEVTTEQVLPSNMG